MRLIKLMDVQSNLSLYKVQVGNVIVRTLNPKKYDFNAPAIQKEFLSNFDKYNISAL